ncbi:MAG: hypothetical protein QM537_04535 [Candidatus Symbiobacter sp.]|nr:hypothetical protein [Candidatus Symbiobacter sp.]
MDGFRNIGLDDDVAADALSAQDSRDDHDHAAKIAALRHEIQLGLDDVAAGRVIRLDMDRLDEYFAKF